MSKILRAMLRNQTYMQVFLFVTQRLNELESLQNQKATEPVVRTNCDQILKHADFTLSFLDEYVADELEKGSQPYKNEFLRNPQPVISRGL